MTKKQFDNLKDGQLVILDGLPHNFTAKNVKSFGYLHLGFVYHENDFKLPTDRDYKKAIERENKRHNNAIAELNRMFGKKELE